MHAATTAHSRLNLHEVGGVQQDEEVNEKLYCKNSPASECNLLFHSALCLTLSPDMHNGFLQIACYWK
jgi:hypothetical protein